MMRTAATIALVAVATVLAACGGRGGIDTVSAHFTVVDSEHVALHARSAADAILAADGALSIAGRPVALTPPQQALLKDYFAAIGALHEDAAATKAAGLATAGTALGSVVSGLASGNPDSIGPKIEAKAAGVKAAAAKIRSDFVVLRAQQATIAAQLPAFRPYARIQASEGADRTAN